MSWRANWRGGTHKPKTPLPLTISAELVRDTSKLPTRGSDGAAGWDLYADIAETWYITGNQPEVVPTGIRVAIPDGYVGYICPRSGLSRKGVQITNAPGVIDSDYRGEISVLLHTTGFCATIEPGDRIAQLVIQPVLPVKFEMGEVPQDTDRGEGGWGSTGR